MGSIDVLFSIILTVTIFTIWYTLKNDPNKHLKLLMANALFALVPSITFTISCYNYYSSPDKKNIDFYIQQGWWASASTLVENI